MEQNQITIVLRVSNTFLVVALMYLVMDTPEKLKNAIDNIVKDKYPIIWGSFFIWVKASTKFYLGNVQICVSKILTNWILKSSIRVVTKLKTINDDKIHWNLYQN